MGGLQTWSIGHRADLLVFAAAALARLACFAWFGLPEENYYAGLATGLLLHKTLGFDGTAETFFEPLYPAVLASLRWATGDRAALVVVLQIALASTGAVILRRLTLALTDDPRAAVIAACFYALHPYLARQAVAYQCLTLTTLLLMLAALQFVRLGRPRAAVWLGLYLGLLLLTRLSLAPLVVLAVAMLLFEGRRRVAVIVLAVCLAVAGPWVLRNYRTDGTLGAGRAGENLYVSTAPFSRELLAGHDVDLVVQQVHESLVREPGNESTADGTGDILLTRAWQHAVAHPWDALYVKIRSALYVVLPRLVPFYPKSASARAWIVDGTHLRFEGLTRRPVIEELTFAAAASAILVLACVGLLKRRHVLWNDRFLLLTLAVYVSIHAVFFATTRLVSPMYFVLMFYAGVGASRSRS